MLRPVSGVTGEGWVIATPPGYLWERPAAILSYGRRSRAPRPLTRSPTRCLLIYKELFSREWRAILTCLFMKRWRWLRILRSTIYITFLTLILALVRELWDVGTLFVSTCQRPLRLSIFSLKKRGGGGMQESATFTKPHFYARRSPQDFGQAF